MDGPLWPVSAYVNDEFIPSPRASCAVFGEELLDVCRAALYVTTEGPGLLITNILSQPVRHN